MPTMNPYPIVVHGPLTGPDGTTTAAMNGLNYLQTVARKYGKRYVKNSLENGKRYLKSRYEMNCNITNSSVSSRCASSSIQSNFQNLAITLF